MDEKFRRLIELGAGDFEQADAALIAHLEGTRCLLKEWHASDILQQAGLYHVAYGTSQVSDELLEQPQRQDVVDVIGKESESIVYHYFACEKAGFLAQFGQVKQPLFYNRLTNTQSEISSELMHQLCELIAAKEIDIAIYRPDFCAQDAERLEHMFNSLQNVISPSAQRKMDYMIRAKA